MKKLILFVLFILIAMSFVSCAPPKDISGTGEVGSSNREISGYEVVLLSGEKIDVCSILPYLTSSGSMIFRDSDGNILYVFNTFSYYKKDSSVVCY